MSYRLTELAEQATVWSYDKYATDKSTGYGREYWFNQKLAELIINETIDMMGVDGTLAKGIKLHFGLEKL
jgi:hypothetical protein